MIERSLDQIGLADIEALVSYGRSEGRTLDYKESFPSPDHKGVRDFLADVTAFANTDGGDIVVGVREDGNGAAAEIVGIEAADLDQELRRIDDQMRTCVDPRVPVFRVQPVPVADGRVVLVMRVGASLIAPHRVVFDKSSRFFRRANRGNFEMSTAELRQAFAASNDLPQRLRDLHRKAVEAIGGKDMPCRIQEAPTVVLTIAPVSVLRDAREVRFTRENVVLPARTLGGIHMIVGLDGIVTHTSAEQGTDAVRAWSVNHRIGYLDFAWTIGRIDEGRKLVWPKYFEDELEGIVLASIGRLRSLEIEGPWIAMVTITGVRDYRIIARDGYLTGVAWQDPAFLGEIMDDALGPETLTPSVERFWRLFGIDQPPPRRGR